MVFVLVPISKVDVAMYFEITFIDWEYQNFWNIWKLNYISKKILDLKPGIENNEW